MRNSCKFPLFGIRVYYITMNLALDPSTSNYQIHSYQPNSIIINNTTYTRSIIISRNTLITDWPPQCLSALCCEHLTDILTLSPTIILLGTGKAHVFPDKGVLSPCARQNIGVEVMSTAAACCTFNVLSAENRNIVAALLIA